MAEEVPDQTIPAIEGQDAPEHDETEVADDYGTLLSQATAAYSQKRYREAAELFSRATELQAEQNGEMSTKNADILYLYGRCLYHVAVEKSDVLGEKVAGEKPKEKSEKKAKTNGESSAQKENEQRVAEEGVAAIATGETTKDGDEKPTATKPFFQFTGDENFDDSDEEEEEEVAADGDEQGPEEEEDEFMNAFEILDLARVLLQNRLEEIQSGTGDEDKMVSPAELTRHVKERLADTHDLQAEISLEGEQFLAAVNDLRSALTIKKELYPQESSYLAELHFKLSLALEFGSVTQPKDVDGATDQNSVSTIDEAMREEAAKEMEAAIASCKLRIEKEEAALEGHQEVAVPGRMQRITRKSIDDVKEMVADMEQRLIELRQPPVSLDDPRGTGALDGSTPLNGILGTMLGESAEQQKQRLEEATKSAKDITGLVRKKAKPAAETSKGAAVTNGASSSTEAKTGTKRKVQFADGEDELGAGKKARVEDANED